MGKTVEASLAGKFLMVSLLGFLVDAAILRFGLSLGVQPAVARLVSLGSAMQTTFLVNGLFVFRCLDLAKPWRMWASYMTAHGFGNLCNYWVFVTLVSLHQAVVSKPLMALGLASVLAFAMNYAAARFVVFGAALRRRRAGGPAHGPPPP